MKDVIRSQQSKRTVGKAGRARTKARGETIGIDLGDKISRYAILNAEGDLVEEGTFRNQAGSIKKHFGGNTAAARVALEAGGQSAWIERELKKFGHEVIVAHARELAWITAADDKNDRSDAEKLARLAWADPRLLKQVHHRSAEQQAQLSVIRARDAVVRTRTLLINTACGIAKGFGQRLPKTVTATFGTRALAMIAESPKTALGRLLAQIDELSASIKAYDQQVADMAVAREDLRPVCSIPGVGPLTALTFALTLGSPERFRHT